MSLFTTEELNKKKPSSFRSTSVKHSGTTHKVILGKSNQIIEHVIGEIMLNQTIHYASMGDWSTHDLIFYILKQNGPSRVYFTTWSISEYAVRQLYYFVESGLILELKGIFDYRNGIHKPAELQLLKNITTDIKPAKCHAKVTVIENDRMGIAVVGSANFTRNPRIEAGVICTLREVAEFHKAWILEELNNTSSFDRNNP
jgi:hypothetical protein